MDKKLFSDLCKSIKEAGAMMRLRKLRGDWDDASCTLQRPVWGRGFIWHVRDRISTGWYNLKYGLQNLWRWRRVIWEDRDWDHMYLLIVMKKKIEQMETTERKFSMHASAPRHAQQLRVCRLLIGRIEEDDYCYLPFKKIHRGMSRTAWQHDDYMKNQDFDLLFKIMSKYIQEWWS